MKLVYYFLSFLATIAFVACSDEPVVQFNNLDEEPISRTITTPKDGVSITNPQLISDWEKCETIVLNRTNGGRAVTVSAPWRKNGVTTSLSYDFRTDVKKEDGWTMLFHTFYNL